MTKKTTAAAPSTSPADGPRPLEDITPPEIFEELQRGVLAQDEALRFVSVAIYKHTTGKVPGNIMLIGNSGTGKTSIMANIQRLYHDVPEYSAFRAVTIINANLLVDAERLEFRPDRLLSAVEQRARAMVGAKPSAEALREAMVRATVCIDEIDKMATVVAGKPNPIGVVLQQGLLTLMEGEHVAHRTHVWQDGEEKTVTLDIDTGDMMFICGGAFEGLYDQVLERVSKPGGAKLKTETIRTAEGQVRIETRFSLAEYMQQRDLFDYGMVPQFISRFDKVVLLNDLPTEALKKILLHSYDSPFVRSKRYFEVLGIELEIEELAAALIAERAKSNSRTGARALRPVFGSIINALEFDPWKSDALEQRSGGGQRLTVTAAMVRKALRN